MDYDLDLSEFQYTSRYINPDHIYYGDPAIHSIILDLIYRFCNRSMKIYDKATLFSRVINFNIGSEYYWNFSIDINLLDIDNTIEIIAVRDNNIKIYIKGNEWYDNIDSIKENKSKTNALAIAKVVKYMVTYIKNNCRDISKK